MSLCVCISLFQCQSNCCCTVPLSSGSELQFKQKCERLFIQSPTFTNRIQQCVCLGGAGVPVGDPDVRGGGH